MKAQLFSLLALMLCASVNAEVLHCEFWSGAIPRDYDSLTYQAARAKALLAQVTLDKPEPAIGSLNHLGGLAAQKSGLSQDQYRYMRLVTIFRRSSSGQIDLVIDGKQASVITLSTVYDSDIIIFHEPVVGAKPETDQPAPSKRTTIAPDQKR